MKNYIFLITFIFSYNIYSQRNAENYAVINIGLNGIVGGVGAIINKKDNEKTGKIFLNGFLKGCAAGTLTYSGKLMSGNIGKESNLIFAWPGKITYWAGNSMMENASMNRPLFEQFNINLGVFRVEYNPSKGNLKAKLLPLSTVAIGYVAFKSKFELEKTLVTGELIFSSSRFNNLELDFRGFTLGNIIVLNSQYVNDNSTISHEIIHVFQNSDFNFINTWVTPSLDKNNFFKKTSPYIYYEFNSVLSQGIYWTQHRSGDNYYRNIFEREAATFSDTFSD